MAWQTTCTVGQWPDQIRISAWFRMAGPAERLAGCRAFYGGPRWETPMADSDSQRPTDIRTPDQRLRVFVSSTLGELTAEREAAREAIEQLRLAPVMFESGARPHPAQDVYRAYLEQSDVFVGIYWQRYGWVGPGMTISGLEDEFRLAAGMPRLLYVKRPAPDMEPGLRRMLDEMQGRGPTWPTRPSRTPRSCTNCCSTTWRPC